MNMVAYPGWMQQALAVDAERKAEIAEKARKESERKAAEQRVLGRALCEALAFFDIAVPAQPVNRVECDFVAFSLRDHDYEPVIRHADGTPKEYRFRLYIEPLRGLTHAEEKSVLVVGLLGFPKFDADLRDARREFAEIVLKFHRSAALLDLAQATKAAALMGDPEIDQALKVMGAGCEPGARVDEFAEMVTVADLYAWAQAEEFWGAVRGIEEDLGILLDAEPVPSAS
jgi:hypothetical protein